MKTIAIDFDGVIHKYSKRWDNGTCYDEPVEGAISALNLLLSEGYSVFILSTRNPRDVQRWVRLHSNQLLYTSESDFFDRYYPMTPADEKLITLEQDPKRLIQYKTKIIRFWTKFWNKKALIGITNRKLPAHVYIDDRGVAFNGDFTNLIDTVKNFKTWQNM